MSLSRKLIYRVAVKKLVREKGNHIVAKIEIDTPKIIKKTQYKNGLLNKLDIISYKDIIKNIKKICKKGDKKIDNNNKNITLGTFISICISTI